ncbi:hypothetical protein D4A49_23965 [Escherichia coli]|nr:hypothetical protein [Escherichia coli]
MVLFGSNRDLNYWIGPVYKNQIITKSGITPLLGIMCERNKHAATQNLQYFQEYQPSAAEKQARSYPVKTLSPTHYSGYRLLSREVVLLFIAVIMLSTVVILLPIVDSNPFSSQ